MIWKLFMNWCTGSKSYSQTFLEHAYTQGRQKTWKAFTITYVLQFHQGMERIQLKYIL